MTQPESVTMRPRVRIRSDGYVDGTHVLLIDEQGVEHEITCRAVAWSIDVETGIARATVELLAVELDVEAPAATLLLDETDSGGWVAGDDPVDTSKTEPTSRPVDDIKRQKWIESIERKMAAAPEPARFTADLDGEELSP